MEALRFGAHCRQAELTGRMVLTLIESPVIEIDG